MFVEVCYSHSLIEVHVLQREYLFTDLTKDDTTTDDLGTTGQEVIPFDAEIIQDTTTEIISETRNDANVCGECLLENQST